MLRLAYRRKMAFSATPDADFSIKSNTPLMKSVLRPVWGITMLLLSACSLEGAPFPSSFTMTGPEQFEFVATGNWIYPANTVAGEAERLTWLRGYISEHQICPAGYKIVERTPKWLKESARASSEEQMMRSITYVGRCESLSDAVVTLSMSIPLRSRTAFPATTHGTIRSAATRC